jgi:hypothetical protein
MKLLDWKAKPFNSFFFSLFQEKWISNENWQKRKKPSPLKSRRNEVEKKEHQHQKTSYFILFSLLFRVCCVWRRPRLLNYPRQRQVIPPGLSPPHLFCSSSSFSISSFYFNFRSSFKLANHQPAVGQHNRQSIVLSRSIMTTHLTISCWAASSGSIRVGFKNERLKEQEETHQSN